MKNKSTDTDKKSLGDYLLKERKKRGYSRQEVSDLTEDIIKVPTLIKIERGVTKNPSIKLLNELANVYELKLKDVLEHAGLKLLANEIEDDYYIILKTPLEVKATKAFLRYFRSEIAISLSKQMEKNRIIRSFD